MAKVDLGEKRVCPECEAKFYDLTKNPATCPMCGHSFDPSQLEEKPKIPVAPLAPEGDDEETKNAEADEEEIDEEEQETKELELDGDDAAIISGSVGTDGDDEGEKPNFDGFSTDDEEDQDAALVDDDDNEMPPPDDKDDDDIEEVEI